MRPIGGATRQVVIRREHSSAPVRDLKVRFVHAFTAGYVVMTTMSGTRRRRRREGVSSAGWSALRSLFLHEQFNVDVLYHPIQQELLVPPHRVAARRVDARDFQLTSIDEDAKDAQHAEHPISTLVRSPL